MVFPSIFIQNLVKNGKNWTKWDQQTTFTFWRESTGSVWNESLSTAFAAQNSSLQSERNFGKLRLNIWTKFIEETLLFHVRSTAFSWCFWPQGARNMRKVVDAVSFSSNLRVNPFSAIISPFITLQITYNKFSITIFEKIHKRAA